MNISESKPYNSITEPKNIVIDKGVSVDILIHILAQIVLFFIGTIIQVKLISVSQKEKDKCWKVHVTHSVVLILNFSFSISFETIIHFEPLLSQHIGSWFCYGASFVTYYCFYSIVTHSLIISLMKYLYIVHHVKLSKLNEETLQFWFLVINIMHPLFLTISNIVASDWGSNTSLNTCFAQVEENPDSHETLEEPTKKPFLCILWNSYTEDLDASYVLRRCLCFVRSVVNVIINSNILEGFFYFSIFRKMKR